MRKLFIWGSIATGVIGAYLMYRRGVPVKDILQETLRHPVRSFATEVKNAV